MSLEAAIAENTKVLQELVSLLKGERDKEHIKVLKDVASILEGKDKVIKEPEKVIEPEVDDNGQLLYVKTKDLIYQLAKDHRDAIKALNKKYELKVFDDILIDKNDPTKGVTSTTKLNEYYKELTSLQVN